MTRSLTPAEQATEVAFQVYAEERRKTDRMQADDTIGLEEQSLQASKAAKAWRNYQALAARLDAEMSPALKREHAALTCEAVAVMIIMIIVGMMLGDGLLIQAGLFAVPVAAWAYNASRRYAAHMRRRAGL